VGDARRQPVGDQVQSGTSAPHARLRAVWCACTTSRVSFCVQEARVVSAVPIARAVCDRE
jgi:hypothetical protein